MSQDLVLSLRSQNRLLKGLLGLVALAVVSGLLVAAKAPRPRFTELDVERINVLGANGRPRLVIANGERLPGPVVDGQASPDTRRMPGLIFYNEQGDECGGLIWKGHLGKDGKPESGMHFSMDRLGGDQQMALGHYEDGGTLETGLNVFDSGLQRETGPLLEAMRKAPAGPRREALKQAWEAAGGRQVQRVFVGKTRGRSSAVILADAKGKPRIMLLVTPEGQPTLQFLNGKGEVTRSFTDGPR
jgi:hypothetical protein